MAADEQTEQGQGPAPQSPAATGTAPQPEASPDPAALEALRAELEAAKATAQENWDRFVRTQAEMENLRKRLTRDLQNAQKYALEKFAGELLAVRDGLELGVQAAGEAGEVDAQKIKEGTELTLRMLSQLMDKYDIRQVDPQGERFNPELHQAVTMQESREVEPNTVLMVMQKGYTLNDRLLRPAMVVVAKAPAG